VATLLSARCGLAPLWATPSPLGLQVGYSADLEIARAAAGVDIDIIIGENDQLYYRMPFCTARLRPHQHCCAAWAAFRWPLSFLPLWHTCACWAAPGTTSAPALLLLL
jgi:hypothetical protein